MSEPALLEPDHSKPYLAEVTSSTSRGRWLALQNTFYYVGQILASGISIPFGRGSSDWAWRAPLLIQMAPAILNAAFVMFLPESPRWLFARGRKEEAARVLAKYHSATQDVNSPVVKIEMQEIEEIVTVSSRDRRWWDFAQLFTGKVEHARDENITRWNWSRQLKRRPNCYRFALCALIAVWGQLSGNGLSTSHLPPFLSSATQREMLTVSVTYFFPVVLSQGGIKDPDDQRHLLLVNSCVSFVAAMAGTVTVDHLGRRTLLLFSSAASVVGMAIVGGVLSTQPGSDYIPTTRAKTGVAFLSE